MAELFCSLRQDLGPSRCVSSLKTFSAFTARRGSGGEIAPGGRLGPGGMVRGGFWAPPLWTLLLNPCVYRRKECLCYYSDLESAWLKLMSSLSKQRRRAAARRKAVRRARPWNVERRLAPLDCVKTRVDWPSTWREARAQAWGGRGEEDAGSTSSASTGAGGGLAAGLVAGKTPGRVPTWHQEFPANDDVLADRCWYFVYSYRLSPTFHSATWRRVTPDHPWFCPNCRAEWAPDG